MNRSETDISNAGSLERGVVDRGQPLPFLAQLRNAIDERASVGVLGVFQYLFGQAFLDDSASEHDCNAICDAVDDAEIVRHQDDGHLELLLELFHLLDDLRLDGDIERGGRLVGDEQNRAGSRGPWRIIARCCIPPLNWWG
jgi:hypothetical protein